jgi:hypothetical protein
LLSPSTQKHAATPSRGATAEGLIREKEITEDHHGATSPIHKWHANIEDMDGQYRDPSLVGERPPDTRQAPTSTDEETNQDGLSVAPPWKRTQPIYPSVTASNTRYPIAKDASKRPKGTASTSRRKAARDDNDTSEGSTIAGEVA